MNSDYSKNESKRSNSNFQVCFEVLSLAKKRIFVWPLAFIIQRPITSSSFVPLKVCIQLYVWLT